MSSPDDACGASLSARCFNGAIGCRVHRVYPERAPEYDPGEYRKCRVCGAATSEACAALSGRVVGGRPDGIREVLPLPHTSRVKRRRRVGR